MKKKLTIFLSAILWAGLISAETEKEPPVNLGAAENFVILTKSGIINNESSSIQGNVGLGSSLSSLSGLHADEISGTIYTPEHSGIAGSVADTRLIQQATIDIVAAQADLLVRCYDFPEIYKGKLGGKTLKPGIYEWLEGATIDQDVIFLGDENDIWIFKVHGPLKQADGTRMILNGGAQAGNIFWYVGESVSIGQDAHMEGIFLGPAIVMMDMDASLNGRILTDNDIILNRNTIKAEQVARLNVTVTANKQIYEVFDEVITYTFVISNTGNVNLTNISVKDTKTGLNETIAILEPTKSVTYQANYIIDIDDVYDGTVKNTMTATGFDPENNEVTGADTETIHLKTFIPAMDLRKTADKEKFSEIGELVTYTIVVSNTGTVTIFDIDVLDPLTNFVTNIPELKPCNLRTYIVEYVTTYEDMCRGYIENNATAIGLDSKEGIVGDSEKVLIIADFELVGLEVLKTADQLTYDAIGQVITYTIVVNNTGHVTLSDLIITDPLTGFSQQLDELKQCASVNYSVEYVITEEDMLVGRVVNTVSVGAKDPKGGGVSASDDETIIAIQRPGLLVTKTANYETFDATGNVITFNIVVENTGNVTLMGLVVEDELTSDKWSFETFSPQVVHEFTATYTTTQSDLDIGKIVNEVTAIAIAPSGDTVESSDAVELAGMQYPSVSITKSASANIFSNAGEQVTYSIILRNTGNVTLTNIQVFDNLTGENWNLPLLLPDAQASFTTNYLITQADLSAGQVVNIASVIAIGPKGQTVEETDSVTITVFGDASISLAKTANKQTYSTAGEAITYTITVENTGNVAITDVTVIDDLVEETWTLAVLQPGAKESFTTVYIIKQADLDAGKIDNLAVAKAKDPLGRTFEDTASLTINASVNAGISVGKTASQQTYFRAGEVITYTIIVENTGNVTLTEIQVSDNLTGESWTIQSLAPGSVQNFTTSYIVIQADLENGSITNTANATGKDPSGEQLSDSDDETITAEIRASVSITKTASRSTYSAVGEQINYVITVENTGNVTLTGLLIQDDLTGQSWTVSVLLPGEKSTHQTSIITTQEHLDAGNIKNVATVDGKDQTGTSVTDTAEENVRAVNRLAALSIDKSSPRPVYARTGDRIDYTIVVTNTGNLTLRNITVTDDLTKESWTVAVLLPGESRSFQTSYVVTQADISREEVINIATAQATDPDGNTISAQDDETAISIRVPGGLTPDTPYDNILIIRGLQYYPTNIFRIFNRYGTMVFEASPYLNDWVGEPNRGRVITDGDGKVPSGTYYYMLELEPGQKPFTGYIYLIKQ